MPRSTAEQMGQQHMAQHDLEAPHGHVFLGEGHERNERRTWAVIALCGCIMIVEIVGGLMFGSIALVADGLHMSTHAGALLLAALAYRYARRLANDSRFTFGTGKLGDLAGFSSAIVLAMIALLIAYEAVSRLVFPVSIEFREAIPIACLGLAVNGASAWLLGGSEHHHHGAGHHHGHAHGDDAGRLALDGSSYPVVFEEHQHANGSTHRDNNMRAAVIHVMADAAVSIVVIVGLLLAQGFDWIWMDPVAGIIGALVTASWSYGLIRDTGAILLDMNPDPQMSEHVREAIEREGDRLADLHLWRLGPGHLAAIVSVVTRGSRGVDYYRARLAHLRLLSHLTVEVRQAGNGA
jgi:cation diffusion facilitator family transporter